MKIFLDSNTVILLAKDKDLRKSFLYLIGKKNIQVFTNDIVEEEVLKNPKTNSEKTVLTQLLTSFILEDSPRYVVIGKSVIGGGDMIAPEFDIWNSPNDSKKAYQDSGTHKSAEQWITNKLNDSRNYDHAINLKADYFICEEVRHQKKKFSNKPVIIGVERFIQLINEQHNK